MSLDRDDLDRLIDQTLSEAVRGEPRRVDAGTVRRALTGSSRSALPLWLAVAAAMLMVFAVTLRERPSAERAATIASAPLPTQVPSSASTLPAAPTGRAASATRGGESTGDAPMSSSPRPVETAPARIAALVREPVFEGLPRLTVPELERPAPLAPSELDAGGLNIAALEISPLSSPALSIEQDH